MSASDPTTQAELLAAVLDAAPTPLWVIGDDGRVRLANEAALATLGYRDVREVVGTPSHATLHERRPDGSDYPSHACPIVSGREGSTAPEWFVTRSGALLPVAWRARRLETQAATLLSFRVAGEAQPARRIEPLAATRAHLRDEVLAHIREHCADPDLDASTVAARHHLSLRSLQVLFAEAGTSPAAEIRNARLTAAERLLMSGAAVGWTAHRCGFSDPGTFARAFRRRYGVAPRAYALGGRDQASVDAACVEASA